MTNPRLVIDTNIYLSAIIFGGNPEKILNLIKEGKATSFTSPHILLEVSQKLNTKFFWEEDKIKFTVKNLAKYIQLVIPTKKLEIIKDDPTDNKILECAALAEADYIITGDKHLLKIKKFGNIRIVKASDFLKTIKD